MDEYKITFCRMDDETKIEDTINLMATDNTDAMEIFQQTEPFAIIIKIQRV